MVLSILTIFWGMCAYLVGALPSGYLIARFAGIDDITQHGSGTIGATNVGRQLGVSYFFLIFFIDAGKAAAMMYLIPVYAQPLGIIMLIIGNSYSPFIRFGGGKGVATLIGILAIADNKVAFTFVVVWLYALIVGRYSFRGRHAVGAASSLALILIIFNLLFLKVRPMNVLTCSIIFAALWSLYMHKEHVKKLHTLFKDSRIA